MAAINFNPMTTLTGSNSFQLQSTGYIQGAFMDDPVARMWVLPGLVANSVTQPVWGGIPITENVPSLSAEGNNLEQAAGNIVIPTTIEEITGFTFFNRAHNMIITPGNPVPQATANMNIAYARLGSNLRVPVKIDPTLASTLEGGAVNTQVAWDFTNNQLSAYSSGTALPVKVLSILDNSKVVNYDSGTGALSWDYTYAALIQI